VTASAPTQVCVYGVKPICHPAGGGAFQIVLPVDSGLACNATAAGTVTVTDSSGGSIASQPITWVGPCIPTTTTLRLPTSVILGWSAPANPAAVTAATTYVISGTVTFTVNGRWSCSETAGASPPPLGSKGPGPCTLPNLPLGTDQVQASYSGTSVYGPSSASATITVNLPEPPAVTTEGPSNVTAEDATFNGELNPEGMPTTYHFEIGWTTAYGLTLPATGSADGGSGWSSEQVWSQPNTWSIQPNTTYHYRLVATNAAGTTYGADVSFTTPYQQPGVGNYGPVSASQNGATVQVSIDPEGVFTGYFFEYGPTTSYGSMTEGSRLPAGYIPQTVTGTLTGLSPATTYHYRAVAYNYGGTSRGNDAQFTTAAASSPPPPPQGYSQVPMYSCVTDGQTVYFYSFDETTGGAWQDAGSLSPQWDAGICPGSESPIMFTPGNQHTYELIAVDPGRQGCGNNDPNNYDCIADSVQVTGNPNGPEAPPFEVS
jgi:hypothetical protein